MSVDFSNREGIDNVISSAVAFLRPPPDQSPVEWAETNISIPLGNAIPGKLSLTNTPYLREPLNMIADPSCTKITLMFGAQTGKTTLINCALGYYIAHDPQSQMMMQPSQGDLNTWLETKFNPMVDSNEVLNNRVAKPRSREGVNNQSIKSYPGGFLMFSWAGSPRTMRGRSAPKIYCDEVDGYEYTAEGHPVNLLWQRAATFGDQRKLIITSTPTIKGSSFVETSYEDGDQRRYYVPCPHCGEYQILKWSNVKWDSENGEHYPETARYVCDHCGVLLDNADKKLMVKRGEWRATKRFAGHASYHLNELYSMFRKWGDIVESFLEKKANNDIQSFVNVSLAETWEEVGEVADPHALKTMSENYDERDDIGILFATAGVDVQKDRIEMSVIGWKNGFEAWVISHSVIWGDTLNGEVWENLDDLLVKRYCGHRLAAVLVDSGFRTDTVDAFTKKRHGRNVFSAMGQTTAKQIVSNPKQTGGLRAMRVDVGVDIVKIRLLSMLKKPKEQIHFSHLLDNEYYDQLTAEKAVTRMVKGYNTIQWHKIRERNEALDCFVYAYAAAVSLNPKWEVLKPTYSNESVEEPVKKVVEPEVVVSEEMKKPPVRRMKPSRRGGFVRNF